MRIPIGSLSLELPDTWKDRTIHTFIAPKVISPVSSPHLRLGPGFRENFNIGRERVKSGTDPRRYLKGQIVELKDRLMNFEIVEEQEMIFQGHPAYNISYQFSLRNARLKVCQMRVALLIGREMINFTGTAAASVFESKKMIFMKILNSIEIP